MAPLTLRAWRLLHTEEANDGSGRSPTAAAILRAAATLPPLGWAARSPLSWAEEGGPAVEVQVLAGVDSAHRDRLPAGTVSAGELAIHVSRLRGATRVVRARATATHDTATLRAVRSWGTPPAGFFGHLLRLAGIPIVLAVFVIAELGAIVRGLFGRAPRRPLFARRRVSRQHPARADAPCPPCTLLLVEVALDGEANGGDASVFIAAAELSADGDTAETQLEMLGRELGAMRELSPSAGGDDVPLVLALFGPGGIPYQAFESSLGEPRDGVSSNDPPPPETCCAKGLADFGSDTGMLFPAEDIPPFTRAPEAERACYLGTALFARGRGALRCHTDAAGLASGDWLPGPVDAAGGAWDCPSAELPVWATWHPKTPKD
jgi:hypothetical protein